MKPGLKFKQAITDNKPLQIVGAVNAYSAIMAEKIGHKALYLSGGGVAACSLGVPDLAITTLQDVLIDANRITDATDLPLLVDIDTGFGGAFNIARCIKQMEKSGVAAVHMEDQVGQKRCGHRPNKSIVTSSEMVDRIKSATDARSDEDFCIMARTDSLAVEGLDAAIDRICQYIEAGADMIFPEAFTSLAQYQKLSQAINKPILANITEFGATELFNKKELFEAGVEMVLYPLSAFRTAAAASEMTYKTILKDGDQKNDVKNMQSRAELYEYLGYHSYEEKLDKLLGQSDIYLKNHHKKLRK
ncbi:MAG: methylisocitrate lyase [Gammaproteobacteria bacterium]|nr:MAG: methylisocitrate lyase [Gammaproteobacteria bacterium]